MAPPLQPLLHFHSKCFKHLPKVLFEAADGRIVCSRIASPLGPAGAARRSAGPLRPSRLPGTGPGTSAETPLHRLPLRFFEEHAQNGAGRRQSHFSPSHSASLASRRSHFRRDRSLSMPGASDGDYRSSGFSRGHMVPAADVAGNEEAVRDSFLLSNAETGSGSLESYFVTVAEIEERTVLRFFPDLDTNR